MGLFSKDRKPSRAGASDNGEGSSSAAELDSTIFNSSRSPENAETASKYDTVTLVSNGEHGYDNSDASSERTAVAQPTHTELQINIRHIFRLWEKARKGLDGHKDELTTLYRGAGGRSGDEARIVQALDQVLAMLDSLKWYPPMSQGLLRDLADLLQAVGNEIDAVLAAKMYLRTMQTGIMLPTDDHRQELDTEFARRVYPISDKLEHYCARSEVLIMDTVNEAKANGTLNQAEYIRVRGPRALAFMRNSPGRSLWEDW